MIDPKKASLPVQWQNDVEPPTKAQTQRAEQEKTPAESIGGESPRTCKYPTRCRYWVRRVG